MPILLQDTVGQIYFDTERDFQATSLSTDLAMQVISFRVGFLNMGHDVLIKRFDKGRTRRLLIALDPTYHPPLPPHQPKYP